MSDGNVIDLQIARASTHYSIRIKKTIDLAMAWRMDHILVALSLSRGLPLSYVQRVERELKRFLVLRTILPNRDHGVSWPVDELWHMFLTYTRDYAMFCSSIGAGFIHHDPAPSSGVDLISSMAKYCNTMLDYKKIFGESAPDEIWKIEIYHVGGVSCS